MAEVEGIRDKLVGASNKYVVDLIFDSIVNEWGLRIHHTPIKSDSHKIRLAERHFTYVEEYATQRHISLTLAANLILNDYFSFRISTNYATKEPQITPTLTKNNPQLHKVNDADTNKSEVAQITPSQPETKPVTEDKPKSLRGAALLQNIKN
ncbi:MAG: hypothetical protein KME29_12170 [Calothrix sp. FI2-JRJ7]|jgi:hypothetical protein|nr:hypothetical protein [Calothrix sp. FI2-JRJ7]